MRALRTAADETFPMNALVCLTEEVSRPSSPAARRCARAPLRALAWRVCVMPWGSAGRASCGRLSPSDSGVSAPLQSMRCYSRPLLSSQEASCRRMGDFQDTHFEIGGLFYALGMADEVARA